MKKPVTTEFKTRLYTAVKAIEQMSQVEVVVIIRSRSANYRDIYLIWGIFGALLSFSYMMFAPALFDDALIYLTPIVAFVIGYAFAHLPFATRLSLEKAQLAKNVEIMARAVFQKAGIQHTQAKIGVLIYCSWLEQSVYVLPDRGAELAVPVTEWQDLRNGFQLIFASKQPDEALLAQLANIQPLFARYLPVLANDVNELPDDMEIEL